MKNNIICLLICLCLSSCIKAKEKDYSYLKIQTELSEQDKKYYENIHNKINEIGKVFAFNPEPDEKTLNNNCSKLEKIFTDLSNHPISRERERERERIFNIFTQCPETISGLTKDYLRTLSLNEWKYLADKLSNSATPWIYIARDSFHKSRRIGITKNTPSNEEQKIISKIGIFNSLTKESIYKALKADPEDLTAYYMVNKLYVPLPIFYQRQYCQKAVEQRQWDHIYYITKNISAVDAIACLDPNDENHKYCNCSEAVRLVIGHWPEEVLENPNFLNPSADPYDGVALRKELKEAIKKYAK